MTEENHDPQLFCAQEKRNVQLREALPEAQRPHTAGPWLLLAQPPQRWLSLLFLGQQRNGEARGRGTFHKPKCSNGYSEGSVSSAEFKFYSECASYNSCLYLYNIIVNNENQHKTPKWTMLSSQWKLKMRLISHSNFCYPLGSLDINTIGVRDLVSTGKILSTCVRNLCVNPTPGSSDDQLMGKSLTRMLSFQIGEAINAIFKKHIYMFYIK